MNFRNWDSVYTICISIRRLAKLDISLHHIHCSLLHRLLDQKMYGQRFLYWIPSWHWPTSIGEKVRLFVNIAMNCELYLVITGYLILEGDNLNKLMSHVQVDIGGLTKDWWNTMFCCYYSSLCPRFEDLSLLSYVSATGALASIIFLCSLLWSGTIDGTKLHRKGTLFNWKGIPVAVSLYAFRYSSHPVFPSLYTSMKNKHQFSNVIANNLIFSNVMPLNWQNFRQKNQYYNWMK